MTTNTEHSFDDSPTFKSRTNHLSQDQLNDFLTPEQSQERDGGATSQEYDMNAKSAIDFVSKLWGHKHPECRKLVIDFQKSVAKSRMSVSNEKTQEILKHKK